MSVPRAVLTDTPELLIDALRHGDARALEALYCKYGHGLSLFGARLVGSRDVAADIVQDVFVSLWERRDRITLHTTIQAYLYAAVRRRAFELLRHQRVVSTHEQRTIAQEESGHAPHAHRPDTQCMHGELTTALRDALESLPPRARMVVHLRMHDQLSRAEIADAMEIAISTVDNHLVAAIRALRKTLRQFRD